MTTEAEDKNGRQLFEVQATPQSLERAIGQWLAKLN